MSRSDPLLEVRDLRVYFRTEAGEARAVDGVSFRAGRGETLAIVGESGSGKTATALSILQLLPDPPARIEPGSSIRYEGRELLGLDEAAMRSVRGNDIAMVFQEPMTSLNPVFKVGEQVAEAVRLHRRAGRTEAWGRAVEMLASVGLAAPGETAHAYPHQLSGGQRQRVMIAMALACDPGLLVADEPTTALDVTVQAQILELLRDLQHRFGMALLLISHDLGVIARIADRVAVMYAGRIVEEGPARRVFEDPHHPYTRGLLRAAPRIDAPADRLHAIPGQVPAATAWPAGCRFHPRCDHTWDDCRTGEPDLFVVAPDRASRCWLARREAPS
jgi:oligopeptide/dipeptide ABC transporter ATP-binding protein